MNTITFTIPSVPPSVNSLYHIHYAERTVRTKPEVMEWKTRAKLYIKRLPEPEGDMSLIRVDRCYWYPWFSSEGAWLSRDTGNFDKVLFDVIAEKLRLRHKDVCMKVGMMDSRNSKVERTVITLLEIPRDEWLGWTAGGELEVKKP